MATAKLTKRIVDGLEPKASRYDVYDRDLRGLTVRVAPGGAKTFSVVYRAGSGRGAPKRRLTIGRYGTLTIEEARRVARETLADVARGNDPAASAAAARGAPTVSQFGETFLAEVDARRKASTAREYRRMWVKKVTPALGSKRVCDVLLEDVSRLHRALRKTPYAANRVLALIGSALAYAERQGVRARHSNPVREIEPYKEVSRERFLTPNEVARLGEALSRAQRVGLPPAPRRRRKRKTGSTAKHRPKSADTPVPANPIAIAAIRFLILTGWREQEVLRLRWREVDLARGTAILLDTKTGKSPRLIGAPALLLLAQLDRLDDAEFVFPGRTAGRPLIEINRVWYAVRHAAKLDDVRLHDLRHSFASVSASSGASLLVIGKLLGHRESATTAKYAHLFDDPVRAAADSAATQLASWLDVGGNPPREAPLQLSKVNSR